MSAQRRAARGRRSADRGPRRGFVLKVVEGPDLGKERVFEREATIGRVEGNDIVILEPGVSRNHARFFQQHGVYLLEDRGSANGTLLNGDKITEAEVLREGDLITLSETTFRFSTLESHGTVATKEVEIRNSALNEIDVTGTREVGSHYPWSTRKGKLVLIVVAALLTLGAGAYWLLGGGGAQLLADQSDVPLTYADEDFEAAVLGFGQYENTHKNKIIIDFQYMGGLVTLQCGAWGIDRVSEVVVVLNGRRVGALPVTKDRWVYGIKIDLPRDKLHRDKANRLVLDNTSNPPGDDPWEVYDIKIIQEAIPPPDAEEAFRLYELGKKRWEDRQVEPQNMSQALHSLKRARGLLEGLEKKPLAYGEIRSLVKKVDRQLTREFEEGLFSAQRAERFGNLNQSRRLLRRTMRYFEKDDFRYTELQRQLKRLGPEQP